MHDPKWNLKCDIVSIKLYGCGYNSENMTDSKRAHVRHEVLENYDQYKDQSCIKKQ